MKKMIMLFMSICLSLALISCEKSLESYEFNFYDYMDTFVSINLKASEKDIDTYKEELDDLFSTYHELTNNYETLTSDDTFLENVYTLNQKVGQKVEVDKALFDIIYEAEEIKALTDGYFNISIGKAVDVWKNLIETYSDEGVIPEAEYLKAVEEIQNFDFSDHEIIFEENDGKYYIELQGNDIKLDLGAYAKGYVVQLAVDYLNEQEVEYFSISAGSSSIFVGKNTNEERDYFNIGLTCPVCSNSSTYGLIKFVENQSITTSGNYEQFVLYNNLRYHHIISPVTLMPMQYNHSITLVSDDAGLLDALSTALFSMPDDVLESWMDEHQDDYQISYVKYSYDGVVTNDLLGNLEFELNE